MRRALYVVGGLVLILVLAVVAGLQALKSEAVRGRIAQALSSSLGQPVTIGGLGLSLLPVPSLSASRILIGGRDSTAAPSVAVRSVRVVPRLSSLLPGRPLTIERAELVGLVISVRRDSADRWLVPLPPAGADTGRAAAGPGVVLSDLRVTDGAIRVVDERLRTRSGTPAVTSIRDIAARLRARGGEIVMPELSGRAGGTEVTGSAALDSTGARVALRTGSVRAADLPVFFALAGLEPYPGLSIGGKAPFEIALSMAPGFASHAATGKAAIERVKLGKLALEDARTTFRLERDTLTLDPFDFTAYGGRERGRVVVALGGAAASYSVRTSIRGLDVARALRATTEMKDVLAGRAELAGDLRGRGHSAEEVERTVSGTVKLSVTDGVIRNFPILAALDRALGITESTGNDTRFESLSGTATVGGGKARTSDLTVRAGELTLAGAGTMGFDHSLSLRVTARLSPALSQRLAGRVGLAGALGGGGGGLAIPVTITGTTTAPTISVDVGALAKRQAKGELGKRLLELIPKPSGP